MRGPVRHRHAAIKREQRRAVAGIEPARRHQQLWQYIVRQSRKTLSHGWFQSKIRGSCLFVTQSSPLIWRKVPKTGVAMVGFALLPGMNRCHRGRRAITMASHRVDAHTAQGPEDALAIAVILDGPPAQCVAD